MKAQQANKQATNKQANKQANKRTSKKAEPKAEVKESKIVKDMTQEKPITIKTRACELLCKVVETNSEGRTVGLTYEDILTEILKTGSKTTVNCLRWYSNKIRILADGYQQYVLPQVRPRPIKAKVETVKVEEVKAEVVEA